MAEDAIHEDAADAFEAMWNASEASRLTKSADGNASEALGAMGDMDSPWAEVAWCYFSAMRGGYGS
jgi:hypothetical protein